MLGCSVLDALGCGATVARCIVRFAPVPEVVAVAFAFGLVDKVVAAEAEVGALRCALSGLTYLNGVPARICCVLDTVAPQLITRPCAAMLGFGEASTCLTLRQAYDS